MMRGADTLVAWETYPHRDTEETGARAARAADAKFVVAKNPMNYRVALAGIAKDFLVLDTPGPMPATLDHIVYTNMRGRFYPQHTNLAGIVPHLVQ